MSTQNILTVDEQYIKQLNSKASVELFRDLIWAEAYRFGVPSSKVNISLRVTVADGGVDATIDATNVELQAGGLFEQGRNAYQIKTGDSFKPQNRSTLQKELFNNKPPSIDNLAPEVRSCLDEGGKFVVVCFGLDLIGTERKLALNHLNALLNSCGYTKPNVDIWSVNNLTGFIQKYPAIVLQTNHLYAEPFRTHNEWSNFADMRVLFETGKEQQEILENIRKELHRNDAQSQIRVLGEAGIGKTRLVLEATDTDDLRPLGFVQE